ncbi:GntR family transcriptional regulator [Saccharothrix texasensis]|uniref:GntR family transcriptional regulator n=1 Tax=Saccharothrix texasensis TaxID=103734 RepID=UPI000F4C18C0|nr:GntR family transcriptional regulator [Saccharothrix texasensis]
MADPTGPYETKSEYAYGYLRRRVLDGEPVPGSGINQFTVAKAAGIGTTPLREALKRLKGEGLVELDAHRDARVTPLRAEEARDLVELRRALDPLAVALAAERRTAADVEAIREAAEGLRALPGNPDHEDLPAHRRFHAALYRASRNVLLIGTLDGLWDKSDRYRRMALEVDRGGAARAEEDREHGALVDLVVAGDAEGASAVMRGHVDTSLGAQAAWRLREQG